MKKELLLLSILAVFMLVAISFATATNTQKTKDVEKKVSPLFEWKVKKAIDKRVENMKTKFIDGRVFLSFPAKNLALSMRQQFSGKISDGGTCDTGRICCKVNVRREPDFNIRQILQGKITSHYYSCDGYCVKSINTSPKCGW